MPTNTPSFDPNNPDHVSKAAKDLYDNIAELKALKQELTTRNATLESQLHDFQAASRSRTLAKLPLPEKYDGKRNQFRQFINSVKLHFTVCPDRFPNDASKTGFVASLLRGAALDWITPYLEMKDPMMFNWDAFETKFKDLFDDPHRAKTAVTKLTQLRQGRRPVVAYAAEFRRIVMDADFDNNAQVYWFRVGLTDAILDELTHTSAETDLEKFIAQCVLIDTRLREREVERKRRQVSFAPSPSNSSSVPNDPMIIDSASTSTRRGPLTAEERKRRLENNLCLYCGASGHQKSSCPSRPGNGRSRQQS